MVGLCYLGTVQQTQNGIQSFQGVFFMLITENFFTPMYSVMNQLPTQLPLFRREYTSGLYDAPTFYIANILSLVSISLNDICWANMRRRQCYLCNNYNIVFTFVFLFFYPLPPQVPTLIIEPTVYTTILYCMAGLQNDLYAYFLTVIITILVMAVSTSCGPYNIILNNILITRICLYTYIIIINIKFMTEKNANLV